VQRVLEATRETARRIDSRRRALGAAIVPPRPGADAERLALAVELAALLDGIDRLPAEARRLH
jgi:hypothetical protein